MSERPGREVRPAALREPSAAWPLSLRSLCDHLRERVGEFFWETLILLWEDRLMSNVYDVSIVRISCRLSLLASQCSLSIFVFAMAVLICSPQSLWGTVSRECLYFFVYCWAPPPLSPEPPAFVQRHRPVLGSMTLHGNLQVSYARVCVRRQP
jgi:hypothetical protein